MLKIDKLTADPLRIFKVFTIEGVVDNVPVIIPSSQIWNER